MEPTNRPEPIHGAHNVSCCIYHAQLTTKYRRDVIKGPLIGLAKAAIRMAGNRHEMKILRVGTDVNHAHIFFQKLPKFSESKSINYLKGISSRIIRFNMPCLKLWCEDSFWSDGFWIQTVGYGWEAIDNYVKNQGIGV